MDLQGGVAILLVASCDRNGRVILLSVACMCLDLTAVNVIQFYCLEVNTPNRSRPFVNKAGISATSPSHLELLGILLIRAGITGVVET